MTLFLESKAIIEELSKVPLVVIIKFIFLGNSFGKREIKILKLFKFHYDSINSEVKVIDWEAGKLFKFHYDSINS